MNHYIAITIIIAGYFLLVVLPGVAGAEPVHAANQSTNPLAYPGPAWSPYVVGGLIGVLSMCTFYFSNKPLGASTAYARLAGMIGNLAAPAHTKSLAFFQKKQPKIGWEVALVAGVVLGAFAAAWTGGELTARWLPEIWVARFGADSYAMRTLTAFAGGLLMAFGARTAGGCTSGHGISGTLQLSVGSWLVAICIFLGGIAVAFPLFRL